MEAHVCNHPKVPHTVEYHLLGDQKGGASVSRPFDDLEDADIFSQKIIRQTKGRLQWLKIYRSDNESYVCFRWDNTRKDGDMATSEAKVKLEVDMEPLASAFDNIATGFKNQGNSIKRLWFSQGVVGTIALVDLLVRVLS